ncbi:MAG: hypothetical protein MUE85_17545 [Microscillaceae bacterium]|jgi:hypothetical protein|nr:hypothetical protein [Microscillaceae bacterium]
MQKTYSKILAIVIIIANSLLVFSCKKDDNEEPPSFTLNGRYIVTSATFNPTLTNPPSGVDATNALPFLELGLFGATTCDPKNAANTLLEFGDDGKCRLICKNNTNSKVDFSNWSFSNNQITLNNILIANPNYNPANPLGTTCPASATNPTANCPTFSLPFLILSNLEATSATTLKFKSVIPLDLTGRTSNVDFVLEKQP